MTEEGPIVGVRSDEEGELAGYLDELISTIRAGRSPARSVSGVGQDDFAPTAPEGEETHGAAAPETVVSEVVSLETTAPALTMPETAAPEATAPESATTTPAPELGAPTQESLLAGRQPRRTARASMRDELLALFRDTKRPSPLPLSTSGANPPGPASDHGHPLTEPSIFLRRFLQQAAGSPEPAPTGLADLDARLDGGFGSGLHLIEGRPGVGKTAFLESLAWEAVSSKRPVLYYALREGSMGAWERLISTLGNILGSAIPLGALRARSLSPGDLESLTRLDLALQASVLPYLSLIETIPARADALGAFIEDVRSIAQEAKERHGRIPLILIDDLERLLLLTRARPLSQVLARLDDALVADSMPGLLSTTPPDGSARCVERLPVQTTLALVSVSAAADEAFGRVDLQVRTNARTGWRGTLPLLLERRSGLFALPPTDAERKPVD